MSFINNLRFNKIIFIIFLCFTSNIDFLNPMQSNNEIANPRADSMNRLGIKLFYQNDPKEFLGSLGKDVDKDTFKEFSKLFLDYLIKHGSLNIYQEDNSSVPVNFLKFHPTKLTLATSCLDYQVRTFDCLESGCRISNQFIVEKKASSLAWSNDGSFFAIGIQDKCSAQIFKSNPNSELDLQNINIDGISLIKEISAISFVSSISFHPIHSNIVALGSFRGDIEIIDVLAKKSLSFYMPIPRAAIRELAFSPCGKSLAVASLDNSISIFSLKIHYKNYSIESIDINPLNAIKIEQGMIRCLSFSKSGDYLFFGAGRKLFACSSWKNPYNLNLTSYDLSDSLKSKLITSISVSQSEGYIASGTDDGNVIIFDIIEGSLHPVLNLKIEDSTDQEAYFGTTVLDFDPTGRFLAAGGACDGSTRVWDIYLLAILQDIIKSA